MPGEQLSGFHITPIGKIACANNTELATPDRASNASSFRVASKIKAGHFPQQSRNLPCAADGCAKGAPGLQPGRFRFFLRKECRSMKKKPSSNRPSLARESLVRRVQTAGNILLTNVPMALSGQPDNVRMIYLILTVAASALHIATGVAVWVVCVKLRF
jgi:hypothetical protein